MPTNIQGDDVSPASRYSVELGPCMGQDCGSESIGVYSASLGEAISLAREALESDTDAEFAAVRNEYTCEYVWQEDLA